MMAPRWKKDRMERLPYPAGPFKLHARLLHSGHSPEETQVAIFTVDLLQRFGRGLAYTLVAVLKQRTQRLQCRASVGTQLRQGIGRVAADKGVAVLERFG